MKLELKRLEFSPSCTLGSLWVDGKEECYTLEDPVRKEKIKGLTAIPFGTYRVILSWSPRFRQVLPLLINVPGFDGIRIHPGNTAEDTEGCILVGVKKAKDSIFKSREAFVKLFQKMSKAIENNEAISIVIT